MCHDSLMDDAAVSNAIMEVAASEVTPRFGTLCAADVTEKTPGEVVTEARPRVRVSTHRAAATDKRHPRGR